MYILLAAPTSFELLSTIQYLDTNWTKKSDNLWERGDKKLTVSTLITGVGASATTFSLSHHLAHYSDYKYVLFIGIAGAYDRALALGSVCHVISESWGDLGVTDEHGNFISLFDLELVDKDEFPYMNGLLLHPQPTLFTIDKARGLTVSQTSGEVAQIDRLLTAHKAYGPQIESMEGAAVFYTLLKLNLPYLCLRAISNYVEPRNRDHWRIDLALENLATYVKSFLEKWNVA